MQAGGTNGVVAVRRCCRERALPGVAPCRLGLRLALGRGPPASCPLHRSIHGLRRPSPRTTCRAHDGAAAQHVWLRPEHVVAGCLEAGLLALLGATSLLVSVQSTEAAQAVQTTAFLSAEVAYVGLHVRPLLPLLPTFFERAEAETPDAAADSRWMQCFTASHFFASECALLSMIALASPISSELPVAVTATHLAFHVLYLTITLAAPQWAVQQNTQRVQLSVDGGGGGTLAATVWAWALNALNGADAAAHVGYATLLTRCAVDASGGLGEGLGVVGVAAAAGAAALFALSEYAPTQRRGAAVDGDAVCVLDTANAGKLLRDGRGPTVAVVTGATSGIGSEVATRLGAQGVTVVLVGRTDDDAAAAAQLVRQLHPHADVRPLSCDLASLSDVQLLARRIRDLGLPLHLLINNAGVSNWWPYKHSSDGVELNLAVNYLAPYLLTELLWELLEATAAEEEDEGVCRVVNVSSSAHSWCLHPLRLLAALRTSVEARAAAKAAAEARCRAVYTPWGFYGLSKLCGIVHARRLARSRRAGGVLCVAVHPGIAPTGLARHMGVTGEMLVALERAFGFTVEAAAQRVLDVALSPAVRNGSYYEDGRATSGSTFVDEPNVEHAVWELSADLIAASRAQRQL